MRTIEKTLYKIGELSPEARARAIEDSRHFNTEGLEWWDAVYEDFCQICKILGVTVGSRQRQTKSGMMLGEYQVYFSGFCSQGDGACFEGEYHYKPGALKKLVEYAPQDTELRRIAEDLQECQRRNFYGLSAKIKHSGRYLHSRSMDIEVFDRTGNDAPEETAEAIRENLRDLADWLYKNLESEYEYLTSDGEIAESLEANEVEFYENGEIY
jgi:hypothetical protein